MVVFEVMGQGHNTSYQGST